MNRLLLLLLSLSLLPAWVRAESPAIIRLRQQLAHASADTTRARLFFQLSEETDSNDSIIYYARQSLRLLAQALPTVPVTARRSLGHLRAAALNNLGVGYEQKGQNQEAIAYYEQSLRVRRSLHDQRGLTESYYNLAVFYDKLGDVRRAGAAYQQSLRVAHMLPAGTARFSLEGQNLARLADLYRGQGDTAAARRYSEQALRLLERAGNPRDLVNALRDLAWLHLRAGHLAAAEAYAHRCEREAAAVHYSYGQSLAAAAMGQIRMLQGRLPESRAYYLTMLKLSEELQQATQVVAALNSLAELELKSNRPEAALDYATRGLTLIRQGDLRQWQPDNEAVLAAIYRRQGAYEPALSHYERFVKVRDSLHNEENQRAALSQRLGYEYEKKEVKLKASQEKRQLLAQAEIRRQKLLRYVTTGGAAIVLLLAGMLLHRYRYVRHTKAIIEREQQRSDKLLLNILPAETAQELKDTGHALARHHEQVTVLFADVENFTQLAERLPAAQLVSTLDDYFGHFDLITEHFGLEKIKTIGDAYMLAGGLGERPPDAPAAVVRCALAMRQAAEELRAEREAKGEPTFAWRIGIHTGPVVAGVVGIKKFAYDIWGDTVNTAARMEQSSHSGHVNISEATHALIKDTFICTARGHIVAKHKGELKMYFVEGERIHSEFRT